MTSFDYYSYFVNIIIIFTFLGVLYFGSRLMIRKGVGKVSGKNIEIIEKISLSVDRYLLMFKVKAKVYIVMVHKNGTELIDAIPAEQFDEDIARSEAQEGQFSNILNKFNEFKK